MRKIQTPEEIEKKRKTKTALIGFFMLFILVLSTLGYALLSSGGQPSNQEQNPSSNSLNFQNRILYFSYPYDDVKQIPLETTVKIQNYVGKPLYISSSSNTQISNEILSTLGQYTSRTQEACYGPCELDLPEKDCSENMIIWKDSLETRVYQQESCIFIDGDLRAVDAFLYSLFK